MQPRRVRRGGVAVLLTAGVVAGATGALTGAAPAVDGSAGSAAGRGADAGLLTAPASSPQQSAVAEQERVQAREHRAAVRTQQARAQAEARAAAAGEAEAEAARAAEEQQAQEAAEEAQRARAEEAEAVSRSAQRDPRSLARGLVADRGWSSEQFDCLDSLWTKESSWEWDADNPTSSAYGIPQALPGDKMATEGADWETNPATQIRWGLRYIDEVYGTPCTAWSHSQSVDWY